MTRLADVNTRDIRGAIELGCQTMSSVFNADDSDVDCPFFDVVVRPDVKMGFNGLHTEAHVPGRHINAMLNAEDAAGVALDEAAVEKQTRAAFLSFRGALPLPLNRPEIGAKPTVFMPHNVREGFHALYPLVKYRSSDEARQFAEDCIKAVFEYWTPKDGWDYERLENEHFLTTWRRGTFVSGVARAIGPLVKYYRATGYGPALELAIVLKEKAIEEAFPANGSYDVNVVGGHTHSTTCVMSSLAQLADLTQDSVLMGRVKAFYDSGLPSIRNALGWVIEGDSPEANPDRGEANNTGDILETALILGKWGYAEYYQDVERILRGHLLPSQLRDTSFIEEPPNPDGIDGLRDVPMRLKGAFGFAAPYGHEPIESSYIKFNLDIVGGAVASLCEAYREIARRDESGLWVNLLFDYDGPDVKIESRYTHDALCITPKRPGPLFVRVPAWADVTGVEVTGRTVRTDGGYLLVPSPIPNRPITVRFTLAEEEIELQHRTRRIRVRMRGDEVVAMDNFGADLTFFDGLD
jgi:hypothetical protein